LGVIIKPVEFTKRALKDLQKVTKFNAELVGEEKAKIIAHEIVESTTILENTEYDFKNLGSVDAFFDYLKTEYRKIYHKDYKINYREGNTKIYIVRIFDTRQNPNKNK
jgi:plasmid stabilization system protein ParE